MFKLSHYFLLEYIFLEFLLLPIPEQLFEVLNTPKENMLRNLQNEVMKKMQSSLIFHFTLMNMPGQLLSN